MRCLLLLTIFLASCPRTSAKPPEPPPVTHAAGPSHLLVAVPETALWSKAGGTGGVRATLHQGVEVSIRETSGGWSSILTSGKMNVEGWVRSTDLGCRVSSDTPLLVSPQESADGAPLARHGCMVRIISSEDDWLHVESAPEPFTYFEKGPSYKDPVIVHTKFAGFLVSGWIPGQSCTTDVKPFYPRAPKDGELQIIKEATTILHTPGGLSNQIQGKALPWTRWVTMEVDGTWIRGRTDGQVIVDGWVSVASIGAIPNTNPLNKLAEKKLKDYEVIAKTGIVDDKGRAITELPGGQEVIKLEEDVRGCRVKTTPPIEVEGWLPCASLRNLSVLPEAAIEYGIIDGGAWPPDRGPIPNPLPSWPENVEDEVEKD